MDASPFRENLGKNLVRIRSVVSRVARDVHDADDLTQECCVRILEREGLWKAEKGSFLHWLSRVARNVAANRARDAGRRHKREAPMGEPDPYPAQEAREAVSEEQVRFVLGQFAYLTDTQRRVLQMHYFDGMRTGEIAKKLGVSSEAVSHQLRRALDRLRECTLAQTLLGWLVPAGWFGWIAGFFEDSATASTTTTTAATIGGVTMKAKTIAAAGILGMAFFGYQAYETRREARKERERLEGEIARLAAASEKSEAAFKQLHLGIAALTQEKDAALAEKRLAEMTAVLAQCVESTENRKIGDHGREQAAPPRAAGALRRLGDWMRKKEASEQTQEARRERVEDQYGKLLQEWGLAGEARSAVVEILTGEKVNRAWWESFWDDTVPPEEVARRIHEAGEEKDVALRQILSTSQIAQLQEHDARIRSTDQDLADLRLPPQRQRQIRTLIMEEITTNPSLMSDGDGISAESSTAEMIGRFRRCLEAGSVEEECKAVEARNQRILERAQYWLTPEQTEKLKKRLARKIREIQEQGQALILISARE